MVTVHRQAPAAPRVHEVIQQRGVWYCTAKGPRCGYQTTDQQQAIAHAIRRTS